MLILALSFLLSLSPTFAASDLPQLTEQTIQGSANIEDFFNARKQINTDEIQKKIASGNVIIQLTLNNYQIKTTCYARKYCWHFENFDLTVVFQNSSTGELSALNIPDCETITHEPYDPLNHG